MKKSPVPVKLFSIFLLFSGVFFCSGLELLPKGKLPANVRKDAAGIREIKGGTLVFQDLPIQVGNRYRLEIEARIRSGNALETLPVLEDLLKRNALGKTLKLAAVSFEFHGGKKRINTMYTTNHLWIVSTRFTKYILEFYAIDKAERLRVMVRANDKKNIVEIRKAELFQLDPAKEKYCNINPDLGFGPYNTFGLGGGTTGIFGENPQGLYFELNGWRICDPIPVKAGEWYRLSCKGETISGLMKFQVYYSVSAHVKDQIGKAKQPMYLSRNQREGSWEFQIPEKATWLRLGFSNGILHYMKLEKLQSPASSK